MYVIHNVVVKAFIGFGKSKHFGNKNAVKYTGRRCIDIEKTTSMRKQRVGSDARGCRLSSEMHGLWAPDYDCTKAGRKECEEYKTGGVKSKSISKEI